MSNLDLDQLRTQIDDIDTQITELFKQRMELALDVAKYKVDEELCSLFTRRMDLSLDMAKYKKENGLPVLNDRREKEVLHKVSEQIGEPLDGYARLVFNTMFDASRSYQNNYLARRSDLADRIDTLGGDVNAYTTLSEEYQLKLDAYEGEDKASYRSALLNEMWNNTIATQTYEPGSTFKVITAAMALESGAATRTQTFNCGKQIVVAGQTIHCHSVRDHGRQDIAQALVNSCNPAFAYIGFEVGHSRFKDYFKSFGYTEKTGSDLLGEVSSIYYDTTGVNFGDVELAVYSFGQTFKVTMLQHITALSAVANGGYLVTPHVGKYLTDKNGNVVQTFSTESSRQVVSEDVCKDIMSYLVNSTKNACVSGYDVISKTGTSEKRDTLREDDYVSSCVTFAPAADPKIAILVTVDTPNPEFGIYGSAVAAPAVGRILAEVLPHMGISPNDTDGVVDMVTIRDYKGLNAKDTKEIIEGLGLKCEIKGSGKTVIGQMPAGDQKVAVGGKVILYTDDSAEEATVTVPDVTEKTPESALRTLQNRGLNVQIKGVFDNDTKNCYVLSQSIDPGTEVPAGTIVIIQCRYEGSSD